MGSVLDYLVPPIFQRMISSTQTLAQVSDLLVSDKIVVGSDISPSVVRSSTPCQLNSLMVRWVVRSILHGGSIEPFLVPASASPCSEQDPVVSDEPSDQ